MFVDMLMELPQSDGYEKYEVYHDADPLRTYGFECAAAGRCCTCVCGCVCVTDMANFYSTVRVPNSAPKYELQKVQNACQKCEKCPKVREKCATTVYALVMMSNTQNRISQF